MRLLLDTHVFLWMLTGNARLPEAWRDVILSRENDVYLSVISLWESIVKFESGRLKLPARPEEYLPAQRDRHNILSMDLDEIAVRRLSTLLSLHRDPFDRMLICQASAHDLVLVTVDEIILRYPVQTLAIT